MLLYTWEITRGASSHLAGIYNYVADATYELPFGDNCKCAVRYVRRRSPSVVEPIA